MNEEISKEDQDWLATLTGKVPEGIDPLVSAQALAVRKALTARRDAIEVDAIKFGDSGLSEIRARLQREGLMDSSDTNQLKNVWWARALDFVGLATKEGQFKAAPIWGVAASLMIAVLVVFQVGEPQTDNSLIYRGDPNATTLIVENPELRANEIVASVKSLAVDGVKLTRLKGGQIQLQIKDSESVRDFLLTQRIEAIAVEGIIKIDVVPTKK